jgi:hypothetical protein
VLRFLREDVPLNHAVCPLSGRQVVGAKHLAEPLGRLLEPPTPPPFVPEAVAALPRLGRPRPPALRAILTGQKMRYRTVSEPPQRRASAASRKSRR